MSPAEEIGNIAWVQEIEAITFDRAHKPPGAADELVVEFDSGALPIDTRMIKGAQINAWLFVHDVDKEPLEDAKKALSNESFGYFGGIVDQITLDEEAGLWSLQCRDYTALPLSHEVRPEELNGIQLDQDIDVLRLLDQLGPQVCYLLAVALVSADAAS